MTNPEQDDRQAEAFGRWCDHAQVVIALRELYSASRISFDDLLTLAAHTMSESSELIWTDASSERMCDKAWAPEIEAVRDALWENFEREQRSCGGYEPWDLPARLRPVMAKGAA